MNTEIDSIEVDRNKWLIGFGNGVYDLKSGMFRIAEADDYYSMSVGYDFLSEHELKKGNQLNEVWEFLRQLFPDEHNLKYALQVMASWLIGGNLHNRADFWVGPSASLFSLVEKSFGDYCKTTFLSSRFDNLKKIFEIKNTRVTRIIYDDNIKNLNLGVLKALVSGDELSGWIIYVGRVTFKPLFNVVILCDEFPEYSGDLTLSRISRVLKFQSQFVENPGEKIESWKASFMWILLEEFKKL